jgi:hypothetical protein
MTKVFIHYIPLSGNGMYGNAEMLIRLLNLLWHVVFDLSHPGIIVNESPVFTVYGNGGTTVTTPFET